MFRFFGGKEGPRQPYTFEAEASDTPNPNARDVRGIKDLGSLSVDELQRAYYRLQKDVNAVSGFRSAAEEKGSSEATDYHQNQINTDRIQLERYYQEIKTRVAAGKMEMPLSLDQRMSLPENEGGFIKEEKAA